MMKNFIEKLEKLDNLILKWTRWGIACRIGNKIYINYKLLENIPLLVTILEHEKAHTSGFSKKDVLLDINNPHLKGMKIEYYKFILKNPKTWIEFLPVWRYEGRIAVNPLILSLWGMTFLIVGVIINFLIK